MTFSLSSYEFLAENEPLNFDNSIHVILAFALFITFSIADSVANKLSVAFLTTSFSSLVSSKLRILNSGWLDL